MTATTAAAGFSDPVRQSQAIFRAALDAMAHPGRIKRLPAVLDAPAPLLPTSACLLLALADYETSIWLDETMAEAPAVADFLRFHTGARLVPACRDADFAVVAVSTNLSPLASFAQGTPEYPDRSTTLIVQVETLVNDGWRFRGPGIPDIATFRAAPLPADFPKQLTANRERFPCGVDLVFVTPTDIAALPRSARIVETA